MIAALRSAMWGLVERVTMDSNERALQIVTSVSIACLSWLVWAIYGAIGVLVFWALVAINFRAES